MGDIGNQVRESGRLEGAIHDCFGAVSGLQDEVASLWEVLTGDERDDAAEGCETEPIVADEVERICRQVNRATGKLHELRVLAADQLGDLRLAREEKVKAAKGEFRARR